MEASSKGRQAPPPVTQPSTQPHAFTIPGQSASDWSSTIPPPQHPTRLTVAAFLPGMHLPSPGGNGILEEGVVVLEKRLIFL